MTYVPRNTNIIPENVITSKEEKKYTCGYCGAKQAHMKQCSGCYRISYCSVDCQTRSRPKHKSFCESMSKVSRYFGVPCRFCEKPVTNMRFKRECPSCSETFYCGRTCLGKDWPKHKLVCLHLEESNSEGTRENGVCNVCKSKENLKTCCRCNGVKYCSKACQKIDWKSHKKVCTEEMIRYKIEIEERLQEMRRLEIRCLHRIQKSGQPYIKRKKDEDFSVHLFDYNADITIYKRPDNTSWEKAMAMVKNDYPNHEIICKFDELPTEGTTKVNKIKPYLVVAFIPRYHHYRGRYCVYVEDKKESEMYITLHFKPHDHPYFKWSHMQPGKFIFLFDASIHIFEDFTTGFRLDKPNTIKFFDDAEFSRANEIDNDIIYTRENDL